MLIPRASRLDLCVCVNACTQFKNQLVKSCLCVSDRLARFVSSLKSRGDCVRSQGPLCSPKWWVFSLQFQSFLLYLWCIVTCCCLVTRSCLTLCDPIDCSTPGFPVLHHLPVLAQTHVIESVMPSNHFLLCYPFSSCLQSFPASGSFLMSQFLASGGQSMGASASASVLPMNIHVWFLLRSTALFSLPSKRLSTVLSTWQFISINYLAFSLLYGPTLTTIHDYWENHSFD